MDCQQPEVFDRQFSPVKIYFHVQTQWKVNNLKISTTGVRAALAAWGFPADEIPTLATMLSTPVATGKIFTYENSRYLYFLFTVNCFSFD